MKRIDVLIKIFEIEYEIKNLLDPIYEGGLKDIFEIFHLNFENAAHVLLNYDVFKDGLSYNVDDMFANKWRLNNFVRICLEEQPNLNEEMRKEDTIKVIIELAKIERKRWKTYSFWSEKGVSFDFFDESPLEELIDELLNFELGYVLHDFSNNGMDEGELKEYLMGLLQEGSDV